MTRTSMRQLTAPTYLLACLVIGGSVQMIWFSAALQLAAIALIAWAVVNRSNSPLPREARKLLVLVGLIVAIVIFHLVPFPAAVWGALPGRGPVLLGLAQMGLKPGWQSLSLAPYDTLTAGLALLPPLGMIAAIVLLRAYSRSGLAIALLLGGVLNLMLGVLQVGDSSGAERFYIQPQHNGGVASGFFANPNHMATLLLLCIPFLAALYRSQVNAASGRSRRSLGLAVALIAGALLALFGLVMDRSGAGIALSIPVVLTSVMIVVRPPRPIARAMVTVTLLAIVAFVGVLALPVDRLPFNVGKPASISTRQVFFTTGLRVARDYFSVGSGIGTFEHVYRMQEDPRTIDLGVFVNHAHDDYVEMLIETGILGLLLVGLFLVWFLRNCVRLARKAPPDPYALAGAIAAATILLHSVVDYPLRTSAIAVCFAASLAMLVMAVKANEPEKDLRPTRHVEIS